MNTLTQRWRADITLVLTMASETLCCSMTLIKGSTCFTQQDNLTLKEPDFSGSRCQKHSTSNPSPLVTHFYMVFLFLCGFLGEEQGVVGIYEGVGWACE